jgi:hypothetical protein
MAQLASDVDAAVREAVTGLRRYRYSWDEIAQRLGVTRQAAQMRYGKTASDADPFDTDGTNRAADTVALFVLCEGGQP